jgi:hypothetical protein
MTPDKMKMARHRFTKKTMHQLDGIVGDLLSRADLSNGMISKDCVAPLAWIVHYITDFVTYSHIMGSDDVDEEDDLFLDETIEHSDYENKIDTMLKCETFLKKGKSLVLSKEAIDEYNKNKDKIDNKRQHISAWINENIHKHIQYETEYTPKGDKKIITPNPRQDVEQAIFCSSYAMLVIFGDCYLFTKKNYSKYEPKTSFYLLQILFYYALSVTFLGPIISLPPEIDMPYRILGAILSISLGFTGIFFAQRGLYKENVHTYKINLSIITYVLLLPILLSFASITMPEYKIADHIMAATAFCIYLVSVIYIQYLRKKISLTN